MFLGYGTTDDFRPFEVYHAGLLRSHSHYLFAEESIAGDTSIWWFHRKLMFFNVAFEANFMFH